MQIESYNQKFEYHFGTMFCFDSYVIGKLNKSTVANTEIAKQMLQDISKLYGKNRIVFISNREFGHEVDPKVYKLVNPKTMIGIAIVGTTQEQRIQAATEQSLYSGSFGYFNSLESAISWAKSFVSAPSVS